MENIAFYIKGDSMSPTISNGDIVVCRKIESLGFVEENELYALITNSGGVLVKRIQKIRDQNNKIIQLKLISDNFRGYKPFRISIKDIRFLLKVEKKLKYSDC